MALGIPLALKVVPSTGSTAMSTCGSLLLAVVEHRRVVLLALADDHHAGHRDRAEHRPHGVDRRLVDRLLVAVAHLARGRHGRRLGDPHQLECEVAVGSLKSGTIGHRTPPGAA
jgi:hypothetical protein